ncbi:Ig-like domain-containing protein [Aequorivita echinoideorum]|uniref:T9SS type A sorting domain-containing protein n=1 Tax=Aequorivita echinoideorum TaxID=1549647 RepID=A0ABS5S6A6_9FLAO|nr:T9SS type A sorting domain-containing protein [Aequorivita echinoideorum]MBT0607964.1 T9SS type A sorting domain-containing protein [Aequorivita echinoideorum]
MKTNYKKRFISKMAKVGILCLIMFSTSPILHAQGCVDPTITSTGGPGTICEGDTATLTATHDGEVINWYDAQTGGTLLGSGSPFETDALSSTTSFWAESVNNAMGTPQTGAARVAPAGNSSSSVVAATSPWGLAFNADEDFTINSVVVYLASANPGDITVQLKDNTLAILDEITISCPAGNSANPVPFTLDLDFFVPTGTDYNLVASISPTLVREFSSGHPGFPYPIGTLGSVFGGTINDNDTNATLYYFFYNWTVTPGETCTSDRAEVLVTVTPSPAAPVAESPQTFETGETLADLEVTGENLIFYSDEDGNNEIPITTVLEDGTTYYVSQTVDGCEGDLLPILVQLNLGVQDESFGSLTYFPNPVTTSLKISNSEVIESVIVRNILGQTILTKDNGSLEFEVDMSALQAGNYMVSIFTKFNSKTINVVKK